MIELDPRTHKIVWEYRAKPSYTFFSAAHQRRAAASERQHADLRGQWGRLFEVTPEGEIVWEYVSPFMGPDRVRRPLERGVPRLSLRRGFSADQESGEVDLLNAHHPELLEQIVELTSSRSMGGELLGHVGLHLEASRHPQADASLATQVQAANAGEPACHALPSSTVPT